MSLTKTAMAIALSFAVTTAAMAQSTTLLDARGKVIRVDPGHNVVVLDDGRMYRLTPRTVVLVDNQPAALGTLQPGSVVMLRQAETVTFSNGQYIVAAPGSAPAPVSPPPTVVASAPRAAVKGTIHGKVTDVDSNGEITIKTDKGEFEMLLTPDSARNIRKGDSVVIDATFAPPGTQIIR
jgi:hypothetical protein